MSSDGISGSVEYCKNCVSVSRPVNASGREIVDGDDNSGHVDYTVLKNNTKLVALAIWEANFFDVASGLSS